MFDLHEGGEEGGVDCECDEDGNGEGVGDERGAHN